MQRIVADPLFPVLARYVFPDRSTEDVAKYMRGIITADEFQRMVMYRANLRIMEESISAFSYDGVENIDPARRYLYVSNHRDIMLDASLLQNVLVDNMLPTTEITFGANLMKPSIVVDIGKSNKMFKVERPGGGMKDFYRAMTHLSDYIRFSLLEKHESVWIAQRNGRTKDGMDRTDTGIIKMFSMSRTDDPVKSLTELNILPVSVSYEWEPCDIQKAVELWHTRRGPYTKKNGEDLQSILSGIISPKGRVFFHIGKPLEDAEIMAVHTGSVNILHKNLAKLIDQRICSSYELWPNNYLAHDLLHGSSQYRKYYSDSELEAFLARMSMLDTLPEASEELKEIFLGIYANPVDSSNLYRTI